MSLPPDFVPAAVPEADLGRALDAVLGGDGSWQRGVFTAEMVFRAAAVRIGPAQTCGWTRMS